MYIYLMTYLILFNILKIYGYCETISRKWHTHSQKHKHYKHTTIIDNNVLLEHIQMISFFSLNKLSIKLLTGTREVN